jgi:hypothetical protein
MIKKYFPLHSLIRSLVLGRQKDTLVGIYPMYRVFKGKSTGNWYEIPVTPTQFVNFKDGVRTNNIDELKYLHDKGYLPEEQDIYLNVRDKKDAYLVFETYMVLEDEDRELVGAKPTKTPDISNKELLYKKVEHTARPSPEMIYVYEGGMKNWIKQLLEIMQQLEKKKYDVSHYIGHKSSIKLHIRLTDSAYPCIYVFVSDENLSDSKFDLELNSGGSKEKEKKNLNYLEVLKQVDLWEKETLKKALYEMGMKKFVFSTDDIIIGLSGDDVCIGDKMARKVPSSKIKVYGRTDDGYVQLGLIQKLTIAANASEPYSTFEAVLPEHPSFNDAIKGSISVSAGLLKKSGAAISYEPVSKDTE